MAAKILLQVTVSTLALAAALNSGTGKMFAFTHLGTIDGRSFFSDNVTYRNWNVSAELCRAANLHPAEIETENQWDFLFNDTTLDDYPYWTGGRATVSAYLHGFGWSDRGQNESTAVQCTAFFGGGGFYILPCTDEFYTLCHV